MDDDLDERAKEYLEKVLRHVVAKCVIDIVVEEVATSQTESIEQRSSGEDTVTEEGMLNPNKGILLVRRSAEDDFDAHKLSGQESGTSTLGSRTSHHSIKGILVRRLTDVDLEIPKKDERYPFFRTVSRDSQQSTGTYYDMLVNHGFDVTSYVTQNILKAQHDYLTSQVTVTGVVRQRNLIRPGKFECYIRPERYHYIPHSCQLPYLPSPRSMGTKARPFKREDKTEEKRGWPAPPLSSPELLMNHSAAILKKLYRTASDTKIDFPGGWHD